jgi:uncharacterized protein (DUF983 family)
VKARPTGELRLRVLRRVLRFACPQCGCGALFRRFARPRETCAHCGLVYRRERGAETGSMYLCAAVTEVFAALVIAALWLSFDWSLARYLLVGVPLVLAFCVFFLPFSQALWIGVEYLTDASNDEPWVDAR